MKKGSRVPIFVVLVVALLTISYFVGPTLLGMVTGDREIDISIDSKATTQIEIFPYGYITAGQTFDMGDADEWSLLVYYRLTDTSFRLPSNTKIELVVDGVVAGVRFMNTVLFSSYRYIFRFDDLEDLSLGTHSVYIRLTGSWSVMGEDSVYINYFVHGGSFVFYLKSTDISQPDPVALTNLPPDIQMEPYTHTTIVWTYEYHGALDIEVTDNSVSVYSSAVGPSVVPTEFKYLYSGVVSGDHVITAIFTPTDALGNNPVEDSVNVHVNAGGEVPTFPPSVDRIDISVTQPLVGDEARNIFITNWYSDVAQKGTVDTVIDGTMNVVVTVEPIGAFIRMKVIVSEVGGNLEYPLNKETGWTGDIFSLIIDTDDLSEGLHTVSFWGYDSENAVWYDVGSFTVPIRTSSSMVDPLLVFGISVTLVGTVAVIVFSRTRRRRK